jgi:tripartite-type tricarboxylate transporter receptor subunit TctC
MKKPWRTLLTGALSLALVVSLAGCGVKQQSASTTEAKWPTKDISVVVPWAPGGGTDLTVRALTTEMSKSLGVNIAVVNTPGANGSVGTKSVWTAKHDGYTLMGAGMMPFTSYPVMGYAENTHKDWIVWTATFSPNVLAVRADSPYKDAKSLLDAFKAKPGAITAGTAGVGSGGHMGIEVVRRAGKIEYKHVPYQGGNPAIIAALGGEVDFTPQLSMEMTDMFRAGKLRALAALSDKPLEIDGVKPIPSLGDNLPELKKNLPMGEFFGIAVPKDTPPEVVKKIDDAFKKAMQSETLKKFAKDKGVVLLGYGPDESQKNLDKLASVVCWTLYDTGTAKISPEKFNFAKP